MTTLVCLHGNPLQGQEFEPLLPALRAQGIQSIIHKRPLKGMKLEPLLQSISATAKVATSAPFYLAAYSWGAYLALSYLNRFPENVAGVLLINPLLIAPDERKKTLLNAPFLSAIALKFQARELSAKFVQQSFAPAVPTPTLRQQLENDLTQPGAWRGNRTYQKLMANLPLPSSFASLHTPIQVLWGEQDEVTPIEEQMPILSRLGSFNHQGIPDAGHALPWTHPTLIMHQINHLICNNSCKMASTMPK